jgi:hypothetical protein
MRKRKKTVGLFVSFESVAINVVQKLLFCSSWPSWMLSSSILSSFDLVVIISRSYQSNLQIEFELSCIQKTIHLIIYSKLLPWTILRLRPQHPGNVHRIVSTRSCLQFWILTFKIEQYKADMTQFARWLWSTLNQVQVIL